MRSTTISLADHHDHRVNVKNQSQATSRKVLFGSKLLSIAMFRKISLGKPILGSGSLTFCVTTKVQLS